MTSDMGFVGFKNFPDRERKNSTEEDEHMTNHHSHKSYDENCNPFYKIKMEENNSRVEMHYGALTEEGEEEDEQQWDALILKMARALRRQPDEILERLGMKRDKITTPKGKSSEDESMRSDR